MSARDLQAVPETRQTSQAFHWAPAAASIEIRLPLTVLRRIQALVHERLGSLFKTEAGGALLGRVLHESKTVVEILDVVPAACAHKKSPEFALSRGEKSAFAKLCQASQANGLAVVGFFRSRIEGTVSLDAHDRELAQELFTAPEHVFLIIRQRDFSDGSARFFYRQNGSLAGGSSALEFPFDAEALRERLQEALHAFDAQVIPAPRAPARPNTDPRARADDGGSFTGYLRWIWAVMLCASLAVAGFFAFQRNEAAKARAQTFPVAGMSVEKTGSDLRLTWSRNAPIFANAKGAVLSIRDGDYAKEFGLDTRQQAGAVMYTPRTDEVEFRLYVFGDTDKSESLRVLSGKAADQPTIGEPATVAPPAR